MKYISYNELSIIIRKNIHILQKLNIDLVVGIPRSGMIPAYMISLMLNVDSCSLNEFIMNSNVGRGNTREIKRLNTNVQDSKSILIVDDSIFSGNSFRQAKNKIPNSFKQKIHTLAIISDKAIKEEVDYIFEIVKLPRVFEWNIFHHNIVKKSGFDIDGVLCLDPKNEENDDGVNYLKFIENVSPLFVPTYKIDTIVTNRLEKYREKTEIWLNKTGVRYNKLVMLNLSSKEERKKYNQYAELKANYYKKSQLELFFESNYNQALEIHRISKKPVFCVDKNIMITSNSLLNFISQTKNTRKKMIKKLMPKYIIRFLKSFKNAFKGKIT